MAIGYNFNRFFETFEIIKKKHNADFSSLQTIKRELNKFFKDSRCVEIVYTENTDKPFFGMKVIVSFDSDDIYAYLMEDEPVRISNYSLEFDNRIFDPIIDISPKELTALLLHEVGHVVNDNTAIQKARNYLTKYLTANHTTLKMSHSIHYKEILAFGLKDYISKCNSAIYNRNDIEIMADDFARSYGFSDDLDAALSKISRCGFAIYEGGEKNVGIVFAWALRLYCSVATRRISAIKALTRCKQLTASRLERREYENIIKRIGRIDDSALLSEVTFDKIKTKMQKVYGKTIKSIDDDFYEIVMQVRNVEDEDDALFLMKEINSRVSILSDYLDNIDLPEIERNHCFKVYDKYIKIRDQLAKTQTYKRSTTGIYVNYPIIQDNRY